MIEFTLEISNWNFGNQLTRVIFISQRRKYLLHIDLINDTMCYANECKNNVNGGDEDGK